MQNDNSAHWLNGANRELESAMANIAWGDGQFRSAALAMQKSCEHAIKAVQVSIRGPNQHNGGHDLQRLALQTKQDIEDSSVDTIHTKTLDDNMGMLVILSNIKTNAEYPDDNDFSSFDLDPREYIEDVKQFVGWAEGLCQNNRF